MGMVQPMTPPARMNISAEQFALLAQGHTLTQEQISGLTGQPVPGASAEIAQASFGASATAAAAVGMPGSTAAPASKKKSSKKKDSKKLSSKKKKSKGCC